MYKLLASCLFFLFIRNLAYGEDELNEIQRVEFNALFEQAEFWNEKQRLDLAQEALMRILIADPKNSKALYELVQLYLKDNKLPQAQGYMDQLRAAHPNSPYLSEFVLMNGSITLGQETLQQARKLSRAGKYADAMKTYEKLLNAKGLPPLQMAQEYYQTMSGIDDAGWSKAVDGLYKLKQKYPLNRDIELAYNEVLTYRESTRRKGIAGLATLSSVLAKAVSPWRKALLWLNIEASDGQYYKTYLARYPNDKEVDTYFHSKTFSKPEEELTEVRAKGYQAYEEGNYVLAQKQFEWALKIKADDADSLAGMGLIRLKQEKFALARANLWQAMQLAPEKKEEWLDAYDTASLYASLNEAKKLINDGNYEEALFKLDLYGESGSKEFYYANILKAEAYLGLGMLAEAYAVYKLLAKDHPDDLAIKEGMINVLHQQEKWPEAIGLVESLSVEEQKKYDYVLGKKPYVLRERAKKESPYVAEKTLTEALYLMPSDPWIRLDLARVLDKIGRHRQAHILVNQGLFYGSVDDYYVAALLALDQKRWTDVLIVLSAINPADETDYVRALNQMVTIKTELELLQKYQATGEHDKAEAVINELINMDAQNAQIVSDVAFVLYSSGKLELASQYIKKNSRIWHTDPVEYFTNQVAILTVAGYDSGADAIMNVLEHRENLTEDDRRVLIRIGNIRASIHADKYRKLGEMSEAYGELLARLQVSPDDVDLLLTLARCYQADNRLAKAKQIYQLAYKQNPFNREVLSSYVSFALTEKNLDLADQLLNALPDKESNLPRILLLKAKVARAHGDRKMALSLLEKARQQLFINHADQSWIVSGDDQRSLEEEESTIENSSLLFSSSNPQWTLIDTVVEEDFADDISKDTGQVGIESEIVLQIEELTTNIQKENVSYWQIGFNFTSREGEQGLGELDMWEIPIQFNTPFQTGRLTISAVPTFLDSGQLQVGREGLYGSNSINSNTDVDDSADGIAMGVLQEWDDLKLDLGVTPIGFTENNFVGGVNWFVDLSKQTQLSFNLQRRAVKESVLAYAGLSDTGSDSDWGGITKNSLEVAASYSRHTYGVYGGIEASDYQGTGIENNSAWRLLLGSHRQIVNAPNRQFSAGINLLVMSYDKNLSKFTLGHGGYFSPQEYYAISFPIIFSRKYDVFSYQLELRPGFQDYTEEANDYFPSNESDQQTLNQLVDADAASHASYDQYSASGVGMSLGGKVEYLLADDLSFEGKLGFSNFDSYSELNLNMSLKYLMGGAH